MCHLGAKEDTKREMKEFLLASAPRFPLVLVFMFLRFLFLFLCFLIFCSVSDFSFRVSLIFLLSSFLCSVSVLPFTVQSSLPCSPVSSFRRPVSVSPFPCFLRLPVRLSFLPSSFAVTLALPLSWQLLLASRRCSYRSQTLVPDSSKSHKAASWGPSGVVLGGAALTPASVRPCSIVVPRNLNKNLSPLKRG